MGYKDWFKKHSHKHKQIVEKLLQKGYSKEKIVEYFSFENMKENEPDFCPLYAKNKKCHDIEELNCYFCGCPNFRFCDDGMVIVNDTIQYSKCAINSKDGREKIYNGKIHQDCSNCSIPHEIEYIKEHFSLSWQEIMKECNGC